MKRPPPESVAATPKNPNWIDVDVTLDAGPTWEVWRMFYVPVAWTDEQIRDAFPEWGDKELVESGSTSWEITEIERVT